MLHPILAVRVALTYDLEHCYMHFLSWLGPLVTICLRYSNTNFRSILVTTESLDVSRILQSVQKSCRLFKKFYTVRKSSRLLRNLPDCPEYFQDCPEIFRNVQKFFRLLGNIQEYPEIVQTVSNISQNVQNFIQSNKNSDRPGIFQTVWKSSTLSRNIYIF